MQSAENPGGAYVLVRHYASLGAVSQADEHHLPPLQLSAWAFRLCLDLPSGDTHREPQI